MPYDLLDNLFEAISYAETGSEPDPYIRTRYAPKQGSSAYGPVQLTGSTVKDFYSRYPDKFKDVAPYVNEFTSQADTFLKYGKSPKKKGYSPDYDYGGKGTLYGKKDEYRKMAETVMQLMLNEQGNALDKFVVRWRGVPENQDPNYFKKVRSKLKK